jgi:hypothetical protein
MSEKQPKLSTGRGGKRPGSGRPKGSLDKGNALIREMIVNALDELGGIEYLMDVARSHPTAFVSLIGKTMPLQVTGDGGGPVENNLTVTFRDVH